MSAVLIALTAWTLAASPVEQLEQYNAAGVALLDAIAHLDHAALGHWSLGSAEREGQITIHAWTSGADQEATAHGAIKLVSLDSVDGDRMMATLRYEANTPGRTDRGVFETQWKAGQLESARLQYGRTTKGPETGFVDRAGQRGLQFVTEPDPRFAPPSSALKFQIIRHALGGAATADINGDGAHDLLLTRGTDARLFLNLGDGTFQDATEAAGLSGLEHAGAVVFADFDGDDDEDLYVGRFYGRNQLFANDGQGRFTDVTEASGLATDDMTSALSVSDFDGDGRLDLYIGRFLDAKNAIPTMIHYARNGAPNRLYLGGGDLTFRDVSAQSGADDAGLTLGIAAGDIDRDGDVDLYLANDFGRNVLLQNDGTGRFIDVAKERGALGISAGMSASFGDYDEDGDLDLYVSSVRSNQRWFSNGPNIRGYVLRLVQGQRREALQSLFLDLKDHLGDGWDQIGQRALAGNLLLRNEGGHFADVSTEAGARPFGWYWSSGFFDLDCDGDLDILATNGWITGPDKHDL